MTPEVIELIKYTIGAIVICFIIWIVFKAMD